MTLQHLIQNSLFPVGEENTAYAPYFDGTSYLHMLSLDQVAVGNVTFAPGCRNHWHIHKASQGGGQILLAGATTRHGDSRPKSFTPGTWCTFPPTSSTGTGPHRTAPSSTWPLRSPARTPAANGWNRWTRTNTID